MWTESAVKLIKLSYTSCSTQAARVSSSVIGAHYNITKKERRHLNFCVRSTTAHRGSVGEGRETKKKKCPPRPELTWKDTKGRKKHPIRAFMCLRPGRGESRLSPWPGFVSATLLCNSVSLFLSLSLSLSPTSAYSVSARGVFGGSRLESARCARSKVKRVRRRIFVPLVMREGIESPSFISALLLCAFKNAREYYIVGLTANSIRTLNYKAHTETSSWYNFFRPADQAVDVT